MSLRTVTLRLCSSVLIALATALPVRAQTIAIQGATIHTNVQDELVGTVVIQDGVILRVGRDADIPAGARIIDGTGKVVTPGLIDSRTQIGVVEIGAATGTVDSRTTDPHITASFNPLDGINPSSVVIPVTRVEGITLDAATLEYAFRRSIEGIAERLRHFPTDPTLLQELEAASSLTGLLPFEVNLWKAQNTFYGML